MERKPEVSPRALAEARAKIQIDALAPVRNGAADTRFFTPEWTRTQKNLHYRLATAFYALRKAEFGTPADRARALRRYREALHALRIYGLAWQAEHDGKPP